MTSLKIWEEVTRGFSEVFDVAVARRMIPREFGRAVLAEEE